MESAPYQLETLCKPDIFVNPNNVIESAPYQLETPCKPDIFVNPIM